MDGSAILSQLLRTLVDKGGSDLHITAGSPPQLRLDGDLVPVRMNPLTPEQCRAICLAALTKEQRVVFAERQELDLSFTLKGIARFRVNVFTQRGHVSGAFRFIPFSIRSFESLNLPPTVPALCEKKNGLVLVTGATGSGKSTTLAAMIDRINEREALHILTLEDPIEFMHKNKRCIVNQREIGADSNSFASALKSSLRQDPDVVLIGEMRDLETISAAMTVAETGHLVFATLHTNSAVATINRIIDVFPSHQQPQIRTQLASNLQGVLCQELLPSSQGGRVLSVELMIPNAAIRSQIRDDKIHLIPQSMQVASAGGAMVTRNQSLLKLLSRKLISPQIALESSTDPEEIKQALGRGGLTAS